MTIPANEVTGLILAGGRATRMGGLDKGLQPLNGEPLVLHALRRLRPQVSHVLINANRHIDLYEQYGMPVVADDVGGFAGPLAGVHAGLGRCPTRYLVTVPCDSPRLPTDLVARLSAALEHDSSDVAVATTVGATGGHASSSQGPQRHPVFMLVKTKLQPQLDAWLASGGRKVDDWLRSVKCAEALFTDEAAFENVNTCDHLNDIARRL